jgi:transposase
LQAVLHQEGFLKPVADVFGQRGRAWLAELALSSAARVVVQVWLQVVDQMNAAILEQERTLKKMAEEDARARWLQSMPGIGAYSAMVILAEIGEIERFHTKRALASYAGLTRACASRQASASAAALDTMDRQRCDGSCCRWRK